MPRLANIQIMGNVGRDAEMRYTPNGKAVTEFSVAVNQSRKDNQTGEWSDETDWFRVTVWGDRAERAAEEFKKGHRVFVDGRFRTREYEDKDHRTRVSLEITATNVVSLEAREATTGVRGVNDRGEPTWNAQPTVAPSGEGGFVAPAGGFGGQTPRRVSDDDLDDLPF